MLKRFLLVLVVVVVLIPMLSDGAGLHAANQYGLVSWSPTLWELSWILWALVAIFVVRKKRYHRDASEHCHEHLISGPSSHL